MGLLNGSSNPDTVRSDVLGHLENDLRQVCEQIASQTLIPKSIQDADVANLWQQIKLFFESGATELSLALFTLSRNGNNVSITLNSSSAKNKVFQISFRNDTICSKLEIANSHFAAAKIGSNARYSVYDDGKIIAPVHQAGTMAPISYNHKSFGENKYVVVSSRMAKIVIEVELLCVAILKYLETESAREVMSFVVSAATSIENSHVRLPEVYLGCLLPVINSLEISDPFPLELALWCIKNVASNLPNNPFLVGDFDSSIQAVYDTIKKLRDVNDELTKCFIWSCAADNFVKTGQEILGDKLANLNQRNVPPSQSVGGR